MSDRDVLRRVLGGESQPSDRQGDRSALRDALYDIGDNVGDAVFKLPYPSTPAPAAPKQPVMPNPFEQQPTAQTISYKPPAANAQPNIFQQFGQNAQASQNWLASSPGGFDVPDWLEGVGGGVLGA